MILPSIQPQCALPRTGTPGFFEGKGRLRQISEFADSHRPLSGLRGGHPLGDQPDERVAHVVLVPCAISRGRIRGALRWGDMRDRICGKTAGKRDC